MPIYAGVLDVMKINV